MRNSSPDNFDELEPIDEELLEAFDAIDTAASSHPTAIPQRSAPNSDAELSGKSQTWLSQPVSVNINVFVLQLLNP